MLNSKVGEYFFITHYKITFMTQIDWIISVLQFVRGNIIAGELRDALQQLNEAIDLLDIENDKIKRNAR